MPPLALEISVAVCDEMRNCVVSEILDRGACASSVVVTPPLTRAFIRSYTTTPGVMYTPPCGDATVRFLNSNESDPESATYPYWRSVWNSDIVSDGVRCIIQNPPPTDGLLAVFEISGLEEGQVTFEREDRANTTVWFDRTDPVGVWVPGTSEYVDIRVEMDQRYTFPGCCEFPSSFNDTVGRLWRQSAQESTCDVTDSAEYVYEGLEYTTTSVYNGTHERWRFESQFPAVGFCSPGFLADSFVVDVFVPRTDLRDLSTVDSVTVSSVAYSPVTVYGVVLGAVVGTVLLVLAMKIGWYYMTKKKKR